MEQHPICIGDPVNAMPHEIAKGSEAGFFPYLAKPIQIKEFMETLNVIPSGK